MSEAPDDVMAKLRASLESRGEPEKQSGYGCAITAILLMVVAVTLGGLWLLIQFVKFAWAF